MARIRILIVDDHPLFRESLKQMLGRFPGYEVVGEGGDARQGETLAQTLLPEVVVVDLSLPDRSGIQLTRSLATLVPTARVIIVSMHAKIDYVISALRAGALGYIVKDSVADCLLRGLAAVAKGDYFLDSALSRELAGHLLEGGDREMGNDSGYSGLTSREQEILRLLAQGLTVKEIGDRLFISFKTVNNHRANIMSKLALHSSTELVRYAAKLGLLDDGS